VSDVDPSATPGQLWPAAEEDDKRLQMPARSDWMRQVHQIRKQEFAYLRSVQQREVSQEGEPTLAGFQTATPSLGTVREDTLKKIDEIEARLNLLWVSSSPRKQAIPVQDAAELKIKAQESIPTAPMSSWAAGPGPFTQVMYDEEMPSSVLLVNTVDTLPSQANHNRSIAKVDDAAKQALDATPLRTEPLEADSVLTTAGVLFAHGENEMAAHHLLRAVRSGGQAKAQSRRRLLALLEIYRATGNQAQFDWSVLEYFDYWDGITPQWRNVSTVEASPRTPAFPIAPGPSNFPASGMDQVVVWRCPSTLSRSAARDLRMHWNSSRHCALDWTSLSSIEPDAAADLSEFFNATDRGPSQLVFFDTPNLLYVLESATPQGQAQVERSLWDLRFCFLKLMHMQVAFDAATADFCLTYIENPPLWQPGRARFDSDAVAGTAAATSVDTSTPDTPWRLQGVVLGIHGLGLPDPALGPGPITVTVACSALVRMDDAATQLLVQWVRSAVKRGGEVHFADVSLLVAAAWEAAGLNAHAQVYLRDER